MLDIFPRNRTKEPRGRLAYPADRFEPAGWMYDQHPTFKKLI